MPKQPAPINSIRGFTLLELVLAISIIVIAFAILVPRISTFQYWREEGLVRKLSETIIFLHHQAITDGKFYRMEFKLGPDDPSYRVGQIIAEGEDMSKLAQLASAQAEAGTLSIELAARLLPSIGTYQSMVPPDGFPSLAEPVRIKTGAYFESVHTMRGLITEELDATPYILFSPRGFSEFAVIHLQLSRENNKVTILVNPFTGLTEIFRDSEFKDFEWTYGRKQER